LPAASDDHLTALTTPVKVALRQPIASGTAGVLMEWAATPGGNRTTAAVLMSGGEAPRTDGH
jgi:hypothetical protein